MPCQLMVGFLAYAKSFEINVDKKELEGNKITQFHDLTFSMVVYLALLTS